MTHPPDHVKQYEPEEGVEPTTGDFAVVMTEQPNGGYVLYSAYAALLAERDAMQAALEVIARGDYDNAHDCLAASRVAYAAVAAYEKEQPYSLFGLRRALRKLRGIGYECSRLDAFVLVERVSTMQEPTP